MFLDLLSYGRMTIGAIGLIAVYLIYSTGQSIVTRYTTMSGIVEKLSHENALITSRLASYQQRIDRRDQAIEASRCSETIKDMVKHPDNIPTPFDPFKSRN
jgi:hypothetical protein